MGFCNVVELRLQQQRLLLERSLKLPQAIGRREGNTEIWVFSCFVSASTARKQAGCCCCWGGEGAYRNHCAAFPAAAISVLTHLVSTGAESGASQPLFSQVHPVSIQQKLRWDCKVGFHLSLEVVLLLQEASRVRHSMMWNVCLFWEEWYLVIWTSYLVCWWKIAFPPLPIFLPVGPAEGMNHSRVTSTVCSKNTVTPGVSLSNNNKMNKFNFLSVLGLCS